MASRYYQTMQFSLALSIEAGLSHHIVNSVISGMAHLNLDYAYAVNFLKENFPSLPLITQEGWNSAGQLLQKHIDNNIECISILDPIYPYSLKIINNPPAILFVRGDLNILNLLPGVAVVGTRQVTPNGAIIAKRISSYLAQAGWVVISGLAIGVDSYAHYGSLEAGGKTIAVLAHGLHKASPKQNALLADEILLKGGAWVSEHPWGVEPRKEFFVHRNRIQIGLSAGSIIIESEIKSGTTTQAEYCIQANRSLFAVVPQFTNNPLGLLSNGPLYLVDKKGASPIKSKEDYPFLLQKLNDVRTELLRKNQ
jgi:DNA processing protein